MVLNRRLYFMKRWYERAKSDLDPFDTFFHLWIALVVAAQRRRTYTGVPFREIYSDREKVLDYFRAHSRAILEVLEKHRDIMTALAGRQGPRYKQAILDTRSLRLRAVFSDLAAHYTRGLPLSEEYHVEAVGELINKIRINLFTGFDVYDDHDDIELLQLVNPLLLEILERCEGLK
jgi:hypothetical protein